MRWNTGLAVAAVAMAGGIELKAEDVMTEGDREAVLEAVDGMTRAFAAGDIDGVMAFYAPGAVVVGAPGQPVAGAGELRAMFAAFVSAGVNFTYGAHEVVLAGDTALHLMKWTIPAGGDADETSALSVAVLKRQPDGIWRMVIDHPFGDGVMRAD
jgi:uncharacterized protein (TIGR02246 family)